MTQAFNPFAPAGGAPAPIASAPQAAPSSALGMNDPAMKRAFQTPFLPVDDGTHRFRVVGYTAIPQKDAPGFSSPPKMAIKLEVVASTSPKYIVGAIHQKNYLWDDERSRPVASAAGPVQAGFLIQFVDAVSGGNPDTASVHAGLKTFDFASTPVYVDCTTTVRKFTTTDRRTKVTSPAEATNEQWRPAT